MTPHGHSPASRFPAPDQWDFSDCTEKELYYCFGYEYGREVESIREHYQHDKARGQNFDAHGYWQGLYPIYQAGRGSFLLQLLGHLFLHFPPGFPDRPFLNTDYKAPRGADLPSDIIPNIPLVATAVPAEDGSFTVNGLPVPKEDVYPLFINWNAPDKKHLEPAFKAWLKASRPKNRRPKSLRGRAALSPLLKRYLKALSVYRLVRDHTPEEAKAHVEALGNKAGHLYRGLREWSEAKALAEQLLQVLRSHEVNLANPEEKRFSRLLVS